MRKKLLGLIVFTLNMNISSAFDDKEHEVGNGGGAWVCRELDGSIRWAQLVDFFEAENEFNLNLAEYSGEVRDVVDFLHARIYKSSFKLFYVLEPFLKNISYLEGSEGRVHYTEDTLENIDDAQYSLLPNVNRCSGGKLVKNPKNGQDMVPYEQVVNFKSDGKILVQGELFFALPKLERAALVFHEAIYSWRRSIKESDTDSRKSRRIVGLIFSTLSLENIGKELALVLSDYSFSMGSSFFPRVLSTGQKYSLFATTLSGTDEVKQYIKDDVSNLVWAPKENVSEIDLFVKAKGYRYKWDKNETLTDAWKASVEYCLEKKDLGLSWHLPTKEEILRAGNNTNENSNINKVILEVRGFSSGSIWNYTSTLSDEKTKGGYYKPWAYSTLEGRVAHDARDSQSGVRCVALAPLGPRI